jgi:hypothetical protein
MNQPMYLRRISAAEYVEKKFGLRCSPKTLAKYAVLGGGPEFRKAGRTPIYEPLKLDEWVESRIGPSVRSTSDLLRTGGA